MTQTQAAGTLEQPPITGVATEGWDQVRDALRRAKAMHFDGCHKIYLSMDDGQVKQSESYGYTSTEPDFDVLRGWFDGAPCGLQSVTAFRTIQGDPDTDFDVLIPQFWKDPDATDEDGEERD